MLRLSTNRLLAPLIAITCSEFLIRRLLPFSSSAILPGLFFTLASHSLHTPLIRRRRRRSPSSSFSVAASNPTLVESIGCVRNTILVRFTIQFENAAQFEPHDRFALSDTSFSSLPPASGNDRAAPAALALHLALHPALIPFDWANHSA
jgi:hypothetical protein